MTSPENEIAQLVLSSKQATITIQGKPFEIAEENLGGMQKSLRFYYYPSQVVEYEAVDEAGEQYALTQAMLWQWSMGVSEACFEALQLAIDSIQDRFYNEEARELGETLEAALEAEKDRCFDHHHKRAE